MYRRLESSLPPDFEFPTTLEGLGYFINENDTIRMIDDPNEPFNFNASKNERYVELQREAMNAAIRKIIAERLANLNVGNLPLPFPSKPDEPHIPILASTNLQDATRIIVYIGESHQDLAIFAGRIISLESINLGSAIKFASDVLVDPATDVANTKLEQIGLKTIDNTDMSDIALVIANPGSLCWWRRGKKALTYQSWQAIPRKYGCGDGPILMQKNRVSRNETPADHVQCLFDDFLTTLAKKGLKIDIIAASDAMESVVQVLDKEWEKWSGAVEAIVCIAHGIFDLEIQNDDFSAFWGKRARAYIVDSSPRGTPMTGRQIIGCNVYSSGVGDFLECIMPRTYMDFLDYFKLVHTNPDYEAMPQDIPGDETEPEPTTWGVDAGDESVPMNPDEDKGADDDDQQHGEPEEHGKVAESA